jgi:hypothetical protein
MGLVLFRPLHYSSGHISALKTWVLLQDNHDPEALFQPN